METRDEEEWKTADPWSVRSGVLRLQRAGRMASFEVELRSDVVVDDGHDHDDDHDDDDDDAGTYDGQVIVRSRSQTVRNPLSDARIGGATEEGAVPSVGTAASALAPQRAPALQGGTRPFRHSHELHTIQRAVRRYIRVKRGFFVPIDDVTVGDADWCIVFDRGPEQERNRKALAKCLLARYGLDVVQSVARSDDPRNPERRKVFMRIRARGQALRDEAEKIGLMCELDPGGVVLNGREMSASELAATGKPRLYGRADANPGSDAQASSGSEHLRALSISEDTRQASYGYHRYTRKRDHFFAKPLQNCRGRFNTGDRQVLVKSLVERALNDYYYTRLSSLAESQPSGQLSHFINGLQPFERLLCNAHLNGQPVALEDLCASGTNPCFCKDAFPERSPHELESLRCWASWTQLEFWKSEASVSDLVYVPLDAIKEYFGTELALYFAFLQYYTKMLIWPALFGLLSTAVQLTQGHGSPNANPLTGPFAIFVSLWAAALSTQWRGVESILAFRWGTAGLNREATVRRTFMGETHTIQTLETEERRLTLATRQVYGSYWHRVKSVMLSVCLIILLIVVALICCTFALWMKAKSNSICENGVFEATGPNVPKVTGSAFASVDHLTSIGDRRLSITWNVTDGNISVTVDTSGLRPGAYTWGVYGRSVSGFDEACSRELIGPELFDLSHEFGNLSIGTVPGSNAGSDLRPRRDPSSKEPQVLHSQLHFTGRSLMFTLPNDGSFMLLGKGERACSAFHWTHPMQVGVDTEDYWRGYCALHWYWMIGGSVFNLFSLTVCSLLYGRMAQWLTDHENWRTDFEYQNSLILKSMVFEGLNNYFLLFYLTFFKGGVLFGEQNTCVLSRNPTVSDCDVRGEDKVCLVPDCMFEMQIQLMIVFVLKTNGKQLWEFLSPYIFWVTSQFFLVRKVSKEQHQANAAVEYMDGAPAPGSTVLSEPSDPNDTPSQSDTSVKSSASLSEIEKIAAQPCSKGTSNEYLTLMIQFGCIGLFSTALPIAPFLAMISNIIELRGDAYKFTHAVRRPPVMNVQGIGTFATILDALAVGAVITNAAIIGLVMTVVAEWFYPGGGVGDSVAERMEVGKLWMAVVLLEHVMLGSVVVVRRAVPAEPGWLESARLRRQLYISKVVDVSLKDLFAEIDEDGSGYLDKSEVAVLVKRLGKRFAGDDDSALTAIMAEMTFESETRDAVQLGQFEAWWRRTMEPSEHVGPGTTPHV